MRTTWGLLRQFIVTEMKLGIAGAELDSNAWGRGADKRLEDPEDDVGHESGPAYAPEEPDSFDPGEGIKSLYKNWRHTHDMAGDPMDV